MTHKNTTPLSTALLLTTAFIAGNAAATPAVWEAQLGTTVPARFLAEDQITLTTLDDTDDGTTLAELTFGSMSFPFAGTTYTGADTLNIASNGFISLGGDNGAGCTGDNGKMDCSGDPDALATGDFARIAPFWTDLDPAAKGGDVFLNRFDDNEDGADDRIVITFAAGFYNCDEGECAALAQVQLLEDGTIIFGYNGITQTVNQQSDVLAGLSPGGGAADPGNTDLGDSLPLDSGTVDTIYELFASLPPPAFDLDDSNLIFTPKAGGGFIVSDSMLVPPPSTAPPTWEPALGASISTLLDKADNETNELSLGGMTFPFADQDYNTVYVSSNGFISLGNDNGPGCILGDCSGNPDWFRDIDNPLIAPLWTDLDPGTSGGDVFFNSFDDDADLAIDRVVITFATGFHDCAFEECAALTQVQLLEDGTIIFGYNGIVQTDSQGSDILVGVSKGQAFPDGARNLSTCLSFDTGTVTTVYELFEAASAPPFDLDGGNIIFEPTVFGGFNVSTQGLDSVPCGGGGGGGGGCSLASADGFDPTLWLVLLAAVGYLRRSALSRH